MATGYGQVTTGVWPATTIGVLVLVTLLASTITALIRRLRRRDHSTRTAASATASPPPCERTPPDTRP